MRLQRFEVPGLAQYSYFIESGPNAIVIDPMRDIDTYVDYAAGRNLEITHVAETHIHADYASGARELAQVTGAELWLSAHDSGEDFEYQFPHREFRDGEEVVRGGLRLTALHTPGHTPEHLSYLVYDDSRCRMPMALLSGDFIFVGSLGRPDLLGESSKIRLAGQLFDSLRQKIGPLPDGLEIHPAHGAGSLCGAGLSERQQTTLGYERCCNQFFQHHDRQKFIEHVLCTVPPFPDYYKRMKRVNSAGPIILNGIPGDQAITPAEFCRMIETGEAIVIDLRRPEAFGGAHIPGAFSIGADQNLAMWAAWVVPYDRPILLVGDDGSSHEGARRALVRVGLDGIRGYLRGGMKAWIEVGYEQAHVPQISVEELENALKKGAHVLDVRSDGEWHAGHIEGAQHIMGGDLPGRTGEVPDDRTVHVICGSGYRSSIATSVLRRAGFKDVVNAVGGMTAWTQRGLPTVSMAETSASAMAEQRS
jgi:hydroxyacylglutathione hydrolase